MLIQLLPRLVPTSRVAIVGPTYAEHELCWRRAGHDVAVVPDIVEASGADIVVIVNPDNPTGRFIPPRALRAIETALLVVDEAFIDFFPPEASLAGDLPANAVVLRSFGKTYGLAGVRLGFAVAPARFARRIKDELGPWAVSGPALAIGAMALGDDAWLQAAAARLARRSRETRRPAGRGGIHDPGRNDAVPAGQPSRGRADDRSFGTAGTSRPRLRASTDLAAVWIAGRRRRIPSSGDGFKLIPSPQVPQKVR